MAPRKVVPVKAPTFARAPQVVVERISLCICTFKRSDLLARLLDSLPGQVRDPAFCFDVVVVDNDKDRSAEETVRAFQLRNDLKVIYDCEPEQNISLTRNRAVRNAGGNLIAFIDDDEYPGGDWLSQLYRTLIRYNADGVLGPVVAEFPPGAPEWLKRGKFLDRRRLTTGTRIGSGDFRTGNVLFRRSIVFDDDIWFDPARGRTGGEDGDFFSRQVNRGRLFVWCDEAVVFETVPEERWKTLFHLKKYLRIGTLAGERHRKNMSAGPVMRSVLAFCGFSLLLPFSLLGGKHLWMRVLLKVTYSASCVSSFCGFPMVRERD